ncbi:MAG: hypothetical protein N3A60_12120, partial [Thermanaerothrix sp.]|nr:hypothetical protein [Thermanaerothrix sp.]
MFARRWCGLFALILLVTLGVGAASAAANLVPVTRLGESRQPITPNDLRPADCAALNLTNRI